MAIYWLSLNEEVEWWQSHPPANLKLGKNEGAIKYPFSTCPAKIGDRAILYQTQIGVQHVGEVYEIVDEHDGRYVYFQIIVLLKQPIPIAEIRTTFEALQSYPPPGRGVSQMKDEKLQAAEALIELIKKRA